MSNLEIILEKCKNDELTISEAEKEICEIIIDECESDYNMGFNEGWDSGYEEAKYE